MDQADAGPMITAIDTNVIAGLWNSDPAISLSAQRALDTAFKQGSLVISGPVFAELVAAPSRTEAFLNQFCEETGINTDFDLGEAIWRAAGRAFQAYALRRRKQREPGPRRILADFLIGAHASHHGYSLLTLDAQLYRSSFPGLTVVTV
ncbi:MAG TPA: type II toxin-antitoxin system VapC family toxin [Candidatus Angelobacter sp.]